MNEDTRKDIKVEFETWKTLNSLSVFSGQPITFIIAEFAKSLQEILNDYPCSRISLMSCRHVRDGKPQDVVTSFCSPIFSGSFAFREGILTNEGSEEYCESRMNEELADKMKVDKK